MSAFRKTIITRLLDASSRPAYLLDDRRRIIYANQSLADWLHVERDSLAGVICDYASDVSSPIAGLCPPLAAFTGSGCEALIHSARASDGDSVSLIAQFTPIAGDAGGVSGVLGVAVDSGVKAVLDPTSEHSPIEMRLHDLLIQMRRKHASAGRVFPLVGFSPRLRLARRQFDVATSAAVSVLVCTHRGQDSECIARAIHAVRHPDGSSGLVPLTCPLLDAELVHTTLSAFMQRCGELETEKPPSLLLLDVDQLSNDAQRELAGFLSIDELAFQTLATASQPLMGQRLETTFRDDLAAALSTVEIIVPRLKDRPHDIPLVVQAALEHRNAHAKQQLEGFDDAALEQLVAYPWPNDLPEVQQVVAKAMNAALASPSPSARVSAVDLPREVRLGLDAMALPQIEPQTLDLDVLLFDIERELIATTLESTRQNRAAAARQLGISRNKLLRRISHLGLETGDKSS